MNVEMPEFLHLVSIGGGKEKGEYVPVKLRINPYMVSSYIEGFISNYKGKEVFPVVYIYVSGIAFAVDMSISEADEMFKSINRNLSINEKE